MNDNGKSSHEWSLNSGQGNVHKTNDQPTFITLLIQN